MHCQTTARTQVSVTQIDQPLSYDFNRNFYQFLYSQMQGDIYRCVHCCMGRNAKNGSGQCVSIAHTQIE